MTDIPVIFSGEMVRKHQAGLKGMTRRLAWRLPSAKKGSLDLWASPWRKVQAGDCLWVRENFSGPHGCENIPPSGWNWDKRPLPIWFWADGNPEDGDWTRPKPSIHMPRWASRITLIVKATKIEPLHAMTIEDAMAEGMAIDGPLMAFPELWDRLHGKGAWAKNPEVVAISYDVIMANIDSDEARAAA